MVIDDKLKFSEHLAKINKANHIVDLIRRTFIHVGKGKL